MKPKVVSLDYDQLISELKQGSEEGFELLSLAYAEKMYDLVFLYFNSKSLSKELVNDALKKIWQEKKLQKDGYDFGSLIVALANNAITNKMTMATTKQHRVSTLFVEINGDKNEMLLDHFQQIIKETILRLPSDQQNIYENSQINDSEIIPPSKESKKVIREFLNKDEDFAVIFLLMAITH